MDWKQFVSQLIGSLAWPIAVLICVALLRKVIADLVPLIRKLKYSELELHFGKEIAALKDVAEVALPSEISTKGQEENLETLIRLSKVRPRTAIKEAWLKVERALISLAKKRSLQPEPIVWTMPMVLGALMFNAGIISDSQYTLLSKLRQLASEAERAPIDSLTSDDAMDVVGLSLRLAASLGE